MPSEETKQTSGTFAPRHRLKQVLAIDSTTLTRARRIFPVQWPDYYLQLVNPANPNDPIARMGRPDPAEWQAAADDRPDPIADQRLRPVPFVVRKHEDRVIILTTKQCHFYCRFCFRREEPVTAASEPTATDWERIFTYLSNHPEIREPILSGGDPLTLSDEHLGHLRDRFEAIPAITHWRIHSRAPVHFPQRVTQHLIDILSAGDKPLTLVTHFNHAQEITDHSRRIAAMCTAAGIQIKNQTVLLAGVNDHRQAQVDLWQGLHHIGIAAYYLHHPDPVPGNSHFRVQIEQGLALHESLKATLSCPAPRYVIDQPNGQGKIDVAQWLAQDAVAHHA